MRLLRKDEYIDLPLNDDGTIHFFKRDKVEFLCSSCGNEVSVLAQSLQSYGYHYNNFPLDVPLICTSCSKRNTFLERYGVENISQLEETKEKVRKTNLKKFGVEYPAQRDDIKERIKQTNLEKYGVESVLQNEEVREKIRKTNLKKYGVENISQLEETKEKVKKTNIKRRGSEFYKRKVVEEKKKQERMKKYGNKHPMKSDFVAEKVGNSIKRKFAKERLKDILEENNITLLEEYAGQRNKKGKALPFKKYRVKCNKCNKRFKTSIRSLGMSRCPVCFPVLMSEPEQELFDFISSFNDNIIKNSRSIIPPLELDIVIPDKKLAIEFNGLYWHSYQRGKGRNYHLEKTIMAKEEGYSLIHIFEDEWINKKEIVKSIIKARLGIFDDKIFARKCEIKEVNREDAYIFFEENHLQGYVGSSVRLGLYYKETGELVSCLALGKSRYNKNFQWEITRFASKINTSVVGGFTKLWSYFLNNYEGDVVTYSDRRLFSGDLYRTNGFAEDTPSPPNYFYFKNMERFSRVKFQKHKLENLLENFDNNLTEKINMENNGYRWIYDCGNWVFKYIRENI